MKKTLYVIAAVAAVVLTSCTQAKETATTFKTDEAQEAVNVKVKKVLAGDVDQLVEFTANVEADVINKIAPQSPTRIRKIYVEVGNSVRKGQKLVDLDDNQLSRLQLQLENQRTEFSRIEELYKVGGASKSAYESMKMNLEVLEANYQNLLENTSLISPIDGVVTARNYDAGDLYSGALPVLVVEKLSPVKILLDVNEQYYRQVKVGMPVENITLDAYPGETFQGKVSIVYPSLDAMTRTFKIEVQIQNAGQRVRPGMFARVSLNFGTVKHVLVPDQAVVKQTGSGERFVYVVNADNTVSHKTVELGRRIGAEYEVVSGVEDGQTVVVFGQTLLTDGRNVNILN
ncbi:MAG: efflux RND transporter periplasmic adaptor subunit [Bacteroidales bacterium]|nr:efflux RND transporter periplasmic adaptor subunit [Candidatus Liminaster caballi]